MIDVTLAKLAQSGQIRRVRTRALRRAENQSRARRQVKPGHRRSRSGDSPQTTVENSAGGTWAANLLGLSTQVPSKIVYLTDGPNKEVPIGRRTIQFNMPGRRPWQGSMANSRLWCKRCGISAKRVLARARLKRSARRYRQRKSASL